MESLSVTEPDMMTVLDNRCGEQIKSLNSSASLPSIGKAIVTMATIGQGTSDTGTRPDRANKVRRIPEGLVSGKL